jgi:hypothetical protein
MPLKAGKLSQHSLTVNNPGDGAFKLHQRYLLRHGYPGKTFVIEPLPLIMTFTIREV